MSHSETLDAIDRRLFVALTNAPRVGMLALARAAGVARNTAQARVNRMVALGIITGFGPELDLRRLGYTVSAFVSVEIAQGRGSLVDEALIAIPEVVGAWMTTGPADLLCHVVAHDNDHLGEVINLLLNIRGVTRTTTSLLLTTRVPPRTLHLVTDPTQSS